MPLGTKPFKATITKPEVRSTTTGKKQTKCTLRTSRKDWKTKEWQGEFWDAVFFSDDLYDKDKIQVDEFSIEQKSYVNQQGQKRKFYDVTVWKYTLLEASPNRDVSTTAYEELNNEDELPF